MTATFPNSSFPRFILFALSLFAALLLSGCGGGGGTVGFASGTALFTTAPDSITIPVGTATYAIGGGTPIYSASSSNPAVATVTVNGTSLRISGLATGTAQIAIRDAAGASLTVNLTVGSGNNTALFTTAPAAVTVSPGGVVTFTIGGGTAPYKASTSNATVATTGIKGTTLTIIGLVAGTAQVTVFDATGASVQIALTVGSGGTPSSLFTTAPTAITVGVGASSTFSIGGGSPAYSASSSNAAVAKVGINGVSFIVTGVAAGTAQVVVVDATGTSVTIGVTVGSGGTPTALYTSAPSTVTVASNGTATYTIGGGTAPYSASSGNVAVATVGVAGTALKINGLAAGAAQIVVLDSTGTSITVGVTVSSGAPVSALYTTAAMDVAIGVGATNGFTAGGGTAPYSATSSNTRVATASISGSALSISGIGAGTAQVLVFDSTGASVTINVTVSAGANTPVDVQPNGASGNVGDVLQFLVAGGTAPYSITVNNPSIASISPTSVGASGGVFSATLRNAGTTDLTIVDGSGQTKTVTLTVGQLAASLRLSPNTLLIGEDSTNSIDLNIYGGTGPYRAFTSDQTLSSVSTSGSVLTVGLGSSLNRCINPIDSSGVRIPNGTFDVTITVIDSLGASATSVMTIKDNGAGNGSVGTQPAPFVAPCT